MLLILPPPDYNPSDGEGKFMQIGGARFSWNAETAQIINIHLCSEWVRGTSSCKDWYKLDGQHLTESIKIVTNNYILGGGDKVSCPFSWIVMFSIIRSSC